MHPGALCRAQYHASLVPGGPNVGCVVQFGAMQRRWLRWWMSPGCLWLKQRSGRTRSLDGSGPYSAGAVHSGPWHRCILHRGRGGVTAGAAAEATEAAAGRGLITLKPAAAHMPTSPGSLVMLETRASIRASVSLVMIASAPLGGRKSCSRVRSCGRACSRAFSEYIAVMPLCKRFKNGPAAVKGVRSAAACHALPCG